MIRTPSDFSGLKALFSFALRRVILHPLTYLLFVAFALRNAGIAFGMPFIYHMDEPFLIRPTMLFLQEGNPFTIRCAYGSFPALVNAAFLGWCAIMGSAKGMWKSLDWIPVEMFYLWGRLLSSLLGTATVWLVYRLGRWFGSRREALTAALLLTVCLAHLRESQYATPNALSALLTLAAMFFAVTALQTGHKRHYTWAGISVGLCVATRFNLFPVGLLFLIAALSSRRKTHLGHSAVGGILAFAAGSPVLLFHPNFSLNDLFQALQNIAGGNLAFSGSWNWLWYFRYLFTDMGLGFWAALFALAGWGLALASSGPVFLLGAYAALHFAGISLVGNRFERYFLPLIPLLCLFAAQALWWLLDRLAPLEWSSPARRWGVGLGGVLLLSASPVFHCLLYDYYLRQEDTRTAATHWMLENIPDGSVIGLGLMRYSPEIPGMAVQKHQFKIVQVRDLQYQEAQEKEGIAYAVLSSSEYQRFLDLVPETHPTRKRLEWVFLHGTLLKEFTNPDFQTKWFSQLPSLTYKYYHHPDIRIYALPMGNDQ